MNNCQGMTADERARYWKQRAKSAEGHLFAGDIEALMADVHPYVKGDRPADVAECDAKYRASLSSVVFVVLRAINSRRDERMPKEQPE